MIKILGVILVLGSATALGFLAKEKLILRKKVLRQMILKLEQMTREIKFSHIELPKIIDKLSDKTPVGNLFFEISKEIKKKDFLSIEHKWAKIMTEQAILLGFLKNDVEILKNISQILGKFDIYEQIKSLELYTDALRSNLDEAEYKLKSEGNILKTLCISAGLLIIIILI